MMSDYRSGRTYVMFNYNNIGWQENRRVAQGYKVSTSSFTLYTSLNDLSYQLPSLIGNRGKTKKHIMQLHGTVMGMTGIL